MVCLHPSCVPPQRTSTACAQAPRHCWHSPADVAGGARPGEGARRALPSLPDGGELLYGRCCHRRRQDRVQPEPRGSARRSSGLQTASIQALAARGDNISARAALARGVGPAQVRAAAPRLAPGPLCADKDSRASAASPHGATAAPGAAAPELPAASPPLQQACENPSCFEGAAAIRRIVFCFQRDSPSTLPLGLSSHLLHVLRAQQHGDSSCGPSAPPSALHEMAAPRLRAATCCLLCGSGAQATRCSVYLEERHPAAGGERSSKSLSIRAGKCKCNSPGRVKSFCTKTKGSFGVCSSPPDWGHAGCVKRHGDSVHLWAQRAEQLDAVVYPARSKP